MPTVNKEQIITDQLQVCKTLNDFFTSTTRDDYKFRLTYLTSPRTDLQL